MPSQLVEHEIGQAQCAIRVFEEFYQVGNPARDRSQGLGLGLAIVGRTALLLGIELQMSSDLGHGTVFELILPPAEAAPASSAADPAARSDRLALSVLVVDDEPAASMSMCTYLQQLGWAPELGQVYGDRIVDETARAPRSVGEAP